ncbi:flavin reductase family protein [Deinococcus psychrotolerans]|uniref:Flavin reductase family protein n=1 Tax=Deinococcus psychrotolerans TaxID=2489213 RepID=A0A3G8YDJ5_9DEIO|nr:flavin reductase family protein [Deinococcus psychrotolerans]AZI43055.1 flavin reductase family protein [Deinococcus psychrotolerans]
MTHSRLDFDFSLLSAAERYKLVTGVVVPRPIAWVSTLNPGGGVNLAPYSFFGLMGSDPAVVAFSPGDRPEGGPKDTARNIGAGGEFVVNMVSRELADAMNLSATDFPADQAEPAHLGIDLAPSGRVQVPRVALSPVSLECREVQTLTLGRTRIILGEVLALSIYERHLKDAENLYVDTASLDLIGRMGGRGGYATTRDAFEIPRLSYQQWLETQGD